MSKKALLGVLLALLLCAGLAAARSRKRSSRTAGSGVPGEFDFYLLSLSWAPDFCDRPDVSRNSRECASGNQVGFIAHGLWPQYENGGYPKQCAPARPVAGDIVTRMLPVMMDAGLVQHEWRDHGTCSGVDSSDYFDLVRRAYAAVKVPERYRTLSRPIGVSPGEVQNQFAQANPSFPRDAFRAQCGGNELSEVHVCFTRELQPRACGPHEKSCALGEMRMLPLR